MTQQELNDGVMNESCRNILHHLDSVKSEQLNALPMIVEQIPLLPPGCPPIYSAGRPLTKPVWAGLVFFEPPEDLKTSHRDLRERRASPAVSYRARSRLRVSAGR